MEKKRKLWTEEEIVFLRYAYKSSEFTTKEISNALERDIQSIYTKASELNLKRPIINDVAPAGYKTCSQCETILPLSYFNKHKKSKSGVRSYCRFCAKKYKDAYNQRKATISEATISEATISEATISEATKKCNKCGETKPLSEFNKNKGMKDGHLNQCKDCKRKDYRKWYITGGYKYD